MGALQFILSQLQQGLYDAGTAIAALEELGYDCNLICQAFGVLPGSYPGGSLAACQSQCVFTVSQVIAFVQSLLSGGANPMPFATPPVPVVTEGPGAGVCATKSGNRGICCAAVTQLGLARAAQGFQYTNCNGKVVCLACGTKSSTSKKHPGQIVFSTKRIACGPSGCPALAGQQTVTPPL